MKKTDRITLFFVLLVAIYFFTFTINLIIPEIAIRLSNTKTLAKVEEWTVDETATEYLVFTYENVYDNNTYTLREPINLQISKDKLKGKPNVEISYNKYFPEHPEILNSGRRSLLLLYIIFVFLCGFACYRCVLGIFGKIKDSDFT